MRYIAFACLCIGQSRILLVEMPFTKWTKRMVDELYIEPHIHIVEKAKKAMEMEGIVPKIQPIRGGTDGANLSFMGLPCPNIFAGGHNFHGKMEYVPLESMEKASKVILNIISLYAE